MKKYVMLLCFSVLATLTVNGQLVTNIKPAADGKIEEYGEWKKAEATWEDGTTATVEFRVRLATRKGIGCHYDLEVKNTSSIKLEVKAKSSYYDKLVKSQFGDEAKENLKPGKSVAIRFVGQGCKKEKGVEKDDFGHCMACDFGIDLYVYK
jgi:hypothetical protein